MTASPSGWTPPAVTESSQTSSGSIRAHESPEKLSRRMAPDEDICEQAMTTALGALQEEPESEQRDDLDSSDSSSESEDAGPTAADAVFQGARVPALPVRHSTAARHAQGTAAKAEGQTDE